MKSRSGKSERLFLTGVCELLFAKEKEFGTGDGAACLESAIAYDNPAQKLHEQQVANETTNFSFAHCNRAIELDSCAPVRLQLTHVFRTPHHFCILAHRRFATDAAIATTEISSVLSCCSAVPFHPVTSINASQPNFSAMHVKPVPAVCIDGDLIAAMTLAHSLPLLLLPIG